MWEEEQKTIYSYIQNYIKWSTEDFNFNHQYDIKKLSNDKAKLSLQPSLHNVCVTVVTLEFGI